MLNKKKICFLAPTAYSLLKGKASKNIIGPDVDQFTLAKELLNHGHKITFITFYEEGPKEEFVGQIRIIKTYKPNSQINIFSKMKCIWKALKKSDSDIYFHYGDSLGIISLFSYLMKKKSIYRIGSDALVNRNIINKKIAEFEKSKLSFKSIGNWLDIKLADIIILQNGYQYKELLKNYKKKGIIIKNHIKIKNNTLENKSKNQVILWVGSITEVKQPELFIELAKMMPKVKFQMIGGHQDNIIFYNKLKEDSKKLDNFEFLGVVPFDEIDHYFNNATILVNTSMFEGFPNSFIQAWMNYMPVVSLNANPDRIITKYKMGFHSKDLTRLKEDLEVLLNSDTLRIEMGTNGRRYIEDEHDFDKIILEYVNIF